MPAVRLLRRELAHLIGEVSGSSSVHGPCGINGVGRRVAHVGFLSRNSSLLLIAHAIVADAHEVLLEATVTAGGYVAINTTQLAGLL